jgi:asparagine synthase (glutamine-hydrolysing)
MCGIAGLVALGPRPVPPEAIKRMCDVQAHRGPNDAGYALFKAPNTDDGRGGYWAEFVDPKFAHVNEHLPVFGGRYWADEVARCPFTLALGHRRLSIIDLTHTGHQPMASSSRRLWVSFNGEIYNYRELRAELEARRYTFRTQSDTEVLLHLWEEYGPAGLARLDGMFAFALYDARDNTLVLARDRFGVKPLYWAVGREFVAFASEIKGILASGEHPAEIAPASLVEYFTFQNTYGDDTLFQGVQLLPAGSYVVLRPGQPNPPGALTPRRFTPPPPPVDLTLTEADARAEVAETFAAAVKRQLVADVEVGAYLSGGMDSGSIVSVAGRTIPRLLTFTGGFDLTNVNGIEQGFDERRLAEKLSYLLQTEHYDVVLHAGDMPAAMERITWHMDDPRVGMCHQNWYVAKLASKFVRVCLAGAGGDELFGGYPWRYRPAFDAPDVAAFDQAYFDSWHRLLPRAELPRLFVPELAAHAGVGRAHFDAIMRDAPEADPRLSRTENAIQRALYFEFRTFLQGFLVTEDHISMAHGLETRVPFLDNALADLSWRLPPALKVDTAGLGARASAGHVETADGKKILRTAMERFLPPEFTQQKKQGFSPPDENWYRGPSMDYIKAVLYDARTQQRPWFDQAFVRGALEEHFGGRRNHRLLIWSLLSFEWLQRHYLDR